MASLRLALRLSVEHVHVVEESEATVPQTPPVPPPEMSRVIYAAAEEAMPPPPTTVPLPKMSREMKALAAFNVVPVRPPTAAPAPPEPLATAPAKALIVSARKPAAKGPKVAAKEPVTQSAEKQAEKRPAVLIDPKMCAEEAAGYRKPKGSAKKRPRKGQFYLWEQFTEGVDAKADDSTEAELAEPDESTLEMVAALAKEEHEAGAVGGSWVRRSVRASGQSELSSRQVGELLEVVKGNHKDGVVLKLKHWLGPDTNTWVMDSVLAALMKNDNCEALYIQNFNDGMLDPQLAMLSRVLRRGHIWCLNIGENYRVSPRAWEQFANALVHSSVTHMYASEHVISPELKTRFRDVIRNNRRKHRRHDSMANLAVIERCTNMWWNPFQSRSIVDGLRARALARVEHGSASFDSATPVEEACCVEEACVAPAAPSEASPGGYMVRAHVATEELCCAGPVSSERAGGDAVDAAGAKMCD